MERQREYGAGEFLAMLLDLAAELYRDGTGDFASMAALEIATAVIGADENMNEQTAEKILEEMADLAVCMLHTSELSLDTRARLERIRNTHPDFAEPATAAAE
jgi:hypothetical protein